MYSIIFGLWRERKFKCPVSLVMSTTDCQGRGLVSEMVHPAYVELFVDHWSLMNSTWRVILKLFDVCGQPRHHYWLFANRRTRLSSVDDRTLRASTPPGCQGRIPGNIWSAGDEMSISPYMLIVACSNGRCLLHGWQRTSINCGRGFTPVPTVEITTLPQTHSC